MAELASIVMNMGVLSVAIASLAAVCCAFSFAAYANPVAGFAFPTLILLASRMSDSRRAAILTVSAQAIGYFVAYNGMLGIYSDLAIQIGLSIALAIVMSVPFVIDRLAYDRLEGWRRILVYPFLAATFEVLWGLSPLGNMFTLAYSQAGFLDSIQMISVIGATGLTFMISLFASAASHMALSFGHERTMDRKSLVCIAVVAIAIFSGTVRLAVDDPSDETISVLCTVGPGIFVPDWEKDSISYGENVLAFDASIDLAVELGADVLFTVEDAYRMDQSEVVAFQRHVEERAEETGLYVMYSIGINEGNEQIWNITSFTVPSGTTGFTYYKTHLMPFDEFCRYSGDGTLHYADAEFGRVTTLVCLDLEYPVFASTMDDDVDILLAPSYDWAGLEGWHTENTSFRAVENGVSYLRNTAFGTIGSYDYLGHRLYSMTYVGEEVEYYLVEVPTDSCQTVFGTYGNVITWLYVLGLIVIFIPSVATWIRKRTAKAED